ncbi:MAG: BrnT family toxin [Acidiferrobacter sp.]
MTGLRFEWDKSKAKANEKKHGVSFDEAKTVFYDENARLVGDPDHSEEEDRFILLGYSVGLKMLVVCHCYRASADTIRIISARKPTRQEAASYTRCYHETRI